MGNKTFYNDEFSFEDTAIAALAKGQFENETVAERMASLPAIGLPGKVGMNDIGVGSILSQHLNGALYQNILSVKDWTFDLAFSATDYRIVAWGTGTLTIPNGKAYTIAANNTGIMTTTTYIYFDLAISETELQITTNASAAVGLNRILVAVANPVADTAKKAIYQVFSGKGGIQSIVTADVIAAGTITGNEIAANTITANKISVSTLSAIAADMGTITAGTITLPSGGHIKSGQTAYDTGTGFYLGNDSSVVKFSLGNSAGQKMTWDGTTLSITGTLTATVGTIGGFTIAATTISATNLALTSGVANTANITVGTGSTAGGLNSANASGDIVFWAGSTFANRASAAYRVTAGGALTATSATITGALTTAASSSIDGQYLTAASVVSSKSNIALQKWSTNCVFSVTDADTIAWATGSIFFSNGTTYSITGANTGNMAAQTYIYLDIAVSVTALQTTTTYSTAVGDGKTLIATAKNGTGEASYVVYGGAGQINLDAANIVASSITANEIAANTITGAKIAATTITAANITAGTITTTEIASTTIVAGNIAAATITGAKIAATTIAASNIVSGTITTTQIASATITGSNIAAATIAGSNIVASTITAGLISVSTLSAISADMGSITAGTIVLPSGGYIRSGQTAFDTGTGFYIGNDSAVPKLSIGNSAGNKMTWNGTTFAVTGALTTAAGSSVDGTYLTAASVASSKANLALLTYNSTVVFSVTDLDTVAWTTGTMTMSNGTSYSIAAGNTGNMAARTYIYLDIAVSVTVLQVTTTATTAVGDGKIMVATAINGAVEPTFIVFGGNGGMNIDASSIVANSITANEIAAATITGTQIAATTIAAGNIVSGTITTTQIAATTITASNIASGTITGTQIAATTIAAGNIVSGTITTTQIAATTITAGNIAAATITTSQIAAATITGSNIAASTITASNITALTITAAEIAASTITAAKLTISQLSAITADMGAITAGSIVLPSGGYIRSGQTAYDTGTGFYLGNVAATPKFSIGIGGSSTASMTFDGTVLTINGSKLDLQDVFGDGSDGNASIIVDTTITRDMYYDNLTIANGGTLVYNTPSGTSGDGYASRASTASFATVRAGTGTQVDNSSASIVVAITHAAIADNFNPLRRGILTFDTSGLPDGATITSATLELYVSAKDDNASQSIAIATRTAPAVLDASDYNIANWTMTAQATAKTIASISTAAYNTWTLNATGLASITKTGTTIFGVVLSCDIDNSAPVWSSGVVDGITFDSATGSNPPKLTITYTYQPVVNTNGYRIFCRSSLNNYGTIRNNGGTGGVGTLGSAGQGGSPNPDVAGGTAGTASAGGFFSAGTAGIVGGIGKTGGSNVNGTAGIAGGAGTAVSTCLGANGVAGVACGRGGNSNTANVGGQKLGAAAVNGGAAGAATAANTTPRSYTELLLMRDFYPSSPTKFNTSAGTAGSSGGSSGGGCYSRYPGSGGGGGGSGGTGGVVFVAARTITMQTGSYIQANGGDGGIGGNGGAATSNGANYAGGNGGGGGGSGGSGGIAVIIYANMTNSGTIQAAGGTGAVGGTGSARLGGDGTDGDNGVTGNNGNAGTVFQLQL